MNVLVVKPLKKEPKTLDQITTSPLTHSKTQGHSNPPPPSRDTRNRFSNFKQIIKFLHAMAIDIERCSPDLHESKSPVNTVVFSMRSSLFRVFKTAFTRCRHILKTVGNLMVKSRCRILMPKKSTYTLRIDQSRSKSVEKCSLYIIVECSHDAVSNLCHLRFRFQNLTFFSKSACKRCAVFV